MYIMRKPFLARKLKSLVTAAALAFAVISGAVISPSAAAATAGTLVLSRASASPGTSIVAAGTGFGRRSTGKLTFDGQWIANFRTDITGRLAVTFTVPSGPARTVVVRAETTATGATAGFSVTAVSTGDPLLSETFTGTDGVFVSESAFWGSSNLGYTENASWMSESGSMGRQAGAGRATSSNNYFRMWTRTTALANTRTEMDVRFNGWYGGVDGWNGVNMWLNRSLCVPQPDCSKINDAGGDAGYVVDFNNRDGSLLIMKKVAGTYHILASTKWSPVTGQSYRWSGRVVDNGSGAFMIELLIDGTLLLRGTDDGKTGGPPLTGGRVGVRGDYADFTIDNISITR